MLSLIVIRFQSFLIDIYIIYLPKPMHICLFLSFPLETNLRNPALCDVTHRIIFARLTAYYTCIIYILQLEKPGFLIFANCVGSGAAAKVCVTTMGTHCKFCQNPIYYSRESKTSVIFSITFLGPWKVIGAFFDGLEWSGMVWSFQKWSWKLILVKNCLSYGPWKERNWR